MDKILRGVLRYNAKSKPKFIADMDQFMRQKRKPLTVLFSCMDARVIPSRFMDSESGQMFIVRNAGNMVPDYKHYRNGIIGTEGAGLELGCVVNNIDNVVVCGHSDCKATNLLYDLQHECDYQKFHTESALKTWVAFHGKKTLHKFQEKVQEPLVYSFCMGKENVTAKIDPEKKFDIKDKFSQIHCLQQASHVSSYPYLKERLDAGALHVFAMWFDVHTGDVYFFNKKLEQFVILNENNVNGMLD